MNIRRLLLDVDKAKEQPSLLEIAEAIEKVAGIEATNIAVDDVDMETIGMQITVEGEHIDYEGLVNAIEKTGAAVHSIDEVIVGNRIVERSSSIPRGR